MENIVFFSLLSVSGNSIWWRATMTSASSMWFMEKKIFFFLFLLMNWNRKWHLRWTLFSNYIWNHLKVIMGKWRVWRRDNDAAQTLSKYIRHTHTHTQTQKQAIWMALFLESLWILTSVDSIYQASFLVFIFIPSPLLFLLLLLLLLKMRCFNFRIRWNTKKKIENPACDTASILNSEMRKKNHNNNVGMNFTSFWLCFFLLLLLLCVGLCDSNVTFSRRQCPNYFATHMHTPAHAHEPSSPFSFEVQQHI